jgi:fatty-acyl-CoA synthase
MPASAVPALKGRIVLEKVFWISYHARRRPDHPALVDRGTGRTLTYAQFDERVRRLADVLVGRGVTRGDRVAVLSFNSINVYEVLYACARIGAVMVPLNVRLSSRELQQIVGDAGPSLFLHDDAHRDTVESIIKGVGDIPSVEWVTTPGTPLAGSSFEQALAAADPDRVPADVEKNLPWIIIYTSGTTGLPKGVVHTVGSVMANLTNSAMAYGVTADTRCLTILPTFHVAGLNLLGNDVLLHGGTVTLMRSFDAKEVLRILSAPEEGITHFGGGPPAVLNMISSLPEFETTELVPFIGAVGGSPVPAGLIPRWADKGVQIIQAFGATEAGSTVLASSTDTPEGSTGAPAAYTEADVRGPDGSTVEQGVPGDLWLRGPMLMKEYWGRPEDTRAVFDDGWLRTGDIAVRDAQGNYRIVDRSKDMYISGGENVYPAEIESILYDHPAVQLAAVVGAPSDRWGETGIAYLTLKDNAAVTAAELRAWCRERLAGYKVPNEFRVVEEMPINATGKILKRELRAEMPTHG